MRNIARTVYGTGRAVALPKTQGREVFLRKVLYALVNEERVGPFTLYVGSCAAEEPCRSCKHGESSIEATIQRREPTAVTTG